MGPTPPDSIHTSASAWADRPGGSADEYLREREGAENFPVALRVLPRGPRTHLAAVYDVARVIDDLGDEADTDRTELLLAFRADLATIWAGGTPETPVLRRLAPTVAACRLTPEPFLNLVEANLLDQVQSVCPTYRDLESYCELSANPVGRIVLEVFGVSSPERRELSDRICTALQIVEHCQDVAEDRRAGRIYLPLDDLDRFGVDQADLDSPNTTPELRKLIAFEIQRAGQLLDDGSPLLRQLHGWARLAVSGYVAGGRAAIVAMRRAQWDVMSAFPHIRRLDVIQQLVAVTAGRTVSRKVML